MSESSERKHKRAKVESETESTSTLSTSEDDGSYESSDASYIILSEDELISEDSSGTGEELDYFGSSSSSVQEESEVAWVDSDEDSQLREEVQDDAVWLHTEGLAKTISRTTKKIAFKYTKRVFTARCKVKLFRCFPHVKVLVDSFNLVYMIFDFEEKEGSYKTYKINLYKISDVCYFSGRILFSSSSSSFIKEMTTEGKVTDIKKGTGNIRKMATDNERLYILGDKVFVLNQALSIKNEFNGQFIDICVAPERVLCLREDGDIYVFDKELNFKEKLSFSFRFQFKRIFSVKNRILIGTDTGLVVLNSDFKEIKTFSNLTAPITALAHNSDFIVHGSDYQNSFRILKDDLSYFDKFPYSKIKINSIETMDIDNDTVYFSDSRFISSLKLSYV